MENSTILTIISAVLGVVALVAGGFWAKAKGKLSQVVNLFKQVYELVDAVFDMLEDDKIEQAEIDRLKAEALDVKEAFKKLFGKAPEDV